MRLQGRVRVAFWVLGIVAAGGSSARAEDEKLFTELSACIRGAAGVTGIDPSMVFKLFARSCSAPCAGLKKYVATDPSEEWRPLGDECDLFCSPKARAAFESAPPAQRWALLAEACGAEYYGLPAGQGALLSEAWFVVQRTGVWLAHADHVAGPKSRLALLELAKMLPADRFLLPLPSIVTARYELPAATHGADDIRSRDYVLVGKDAINHGLLPEAKLSLAGAKLAAPFPGDSIPLQQLASARTTLRTPVSNIQVGGRGVLSPPPSPADKTLSVVRRNCPLLLADRKLPASRLVEVVEALGEDGACVGVMDSRGSLAAAAHALLLTAHPVSMGPPLIQLALGPGFADLVAARALTPAVGLNVRSATVGELAEAMNVLYDGGVHLIVLNHSEPGSLATNKGTLDKDVIRGAIQGHLPDVKKCYQAGLRRRATLAGRVRVRFIISATGSVTATEVKDSTVDDALVEQCITSAVRSWTFPKPSGEGVVSVEYPFVLKPGP